MDPGLLIIILFLLAPLLERLLKAGKQPPPEEPPQRAPRPRPPVRRPQAPGPVQRPAPRVQLPRRVPEPEDNATDMLPEDLWAILTGQQPAPRPVPRPEPEPEVEPWPEPEALPPARPRPSSSLPSRRAGSENASWDDAVAEADNVPVPHYADEYVPMHEAPRVVSLEQLEFDDEVRHTKFHQRLEALPAPARARSAETPAAHRFNSDQDLRRAIIMSEVLGRPKGL